MKSRQWTYHDLVRRRSTDRILCRTCRFGLGVQIGVFVIVSILLLILTRPIAVKFFNQERQKTNAESLIGQHALVTEDIDTIKAKGQVEICGQIWSAKTDEPDGKIPKNTVVVVNGIQA